jgi:hypothetical protein
VEGLEDAVVELRVHERAVATSIRLQALLRSSRLPAGSARAARAARAGEPSPADQATATVLYEQLQFADPADPADVDDDGQEDQEEQMVLSAERLAWLEELRRRIGELARETPEPKPSKRRGAAATPPRRPGYRRR